MAETTIENDMVIENNENFTVTLGAVGGTTPTQAAAITTGAVGTGTITNDDSYTLSVDRPYLHSFPTRRSSDLFTVTSPSAVQGGFTVAYSTSNGSATAGSDYE